MTIQRELSIEERCAFANLLGDQRLTGIASRYTPTSIRTLGVSWTGGATIATMHERLDQQNVPRYTDNPYPAFEVEDFIQSQNARLYAVQLQEDGSLKYTNHGYLETMLAKSLNGYLKRRGDDLLYIRDEEGNMVDVLIRPGDFLIRRPSDMNTYAYWLPPRDGEDEEVK
ncbi:hypothetical protein D3C87_1545810 [compost metagenome]